MRNEENVTRLRRRSESIILTMQRVLDFIRGTKLPMCQRNDSSRTEETLDGCYFRCTECWFKKSIRMDSLSARCKLELKQILVLTIKWVVGTKVTTAVSPANASERWQCSDMNITVKYVSAYCSLTNPIWRTGKNRVIGSVFL
ncbi:hypothetical protein EWB00_008967 [Schistosoma japonicum]|uniref:Uncharacterized protein n=1 Tax=Schistosoma japonicum TaxID=6182 RepID=A0A4Z2CNB0_SCHJA|nr:hypothetical protein EWB00_008967 [Schistosoma japonicum]